MEALAALEMIVCLAVAYSIRGYAVWPVGLFVVFRGGRVLRRHMCASARGGRVLRRICLHSARSKQGVCTSIFGPTFGSKRQ